MPNTDLKRTLPQGRRQVFKGGGLDPRYDKRGGGGGCCPLQARYEKRGCVCVCGGGGGGGCSLVPRPRFPTAAVDYITATWKVAP